MSHWVVLTALLMLTANRSISFSRTAILIFAGGWLAALTAFLANLAAGHFIFLGIYLLLTTFLSIYMGSLYADLFISIFVINLFGILSAGFATSVSGGLERSAYILLGATIALVIWGLFGRERLEKKARKTLAFSLKSMSELNKVVFFCYIYRDYQKKYFLYEKSLQEKRKSVLLYLHQARQLIEKAVKERQSLDILLNRVERIYELIIALGELRYREPDQSTFEMGARELSAISADIVLALDDLSHAMLKKQASETFANPLLENILQLEEVNQNAFQVAAKEPIAFTLFIRYLKTLAEELNQSFGDISAWWHSHE